MDMDIFQMSLSASVLIVAVVIIRALTLHKLPKKTFLVLWGVVICRLLIPFSISSRFSFYTGIDMAKHMFAKRAAALSSAGIPGVLANGNMPGTGEPIIGVVASATISPIEIVWLAGMCACALFFIVAYIKCHREFKMSLPVENDIVTRWLREHPLRRPVKIRQSDRIKAPLTYGILQPVVLLPKNTDWTDEARLKVILTHELVHIRRFDTLTKLVLTAAVCVHWFNPLVWVMYVLANRDIELSCDETVVRTFGETIKSAYALTLIGLEEKKSRLTPLVNNFSKNAIEERIVSIMKIKKTSLMGIFLAFALVISTVAVFATNAVASAANEEPVEAFESNALLSDEENVKQEQERKEEIAKQYSVYSKYGLTYNQEKDRFFYNGQLVRYFADKLDENGTYNSFSYTDGDIDLRGVRNAKYELIGIEPVSQEEYDQRTAKIQASKDFTGIQENGGAVSTDTNFAAIEAGEPNKNTSGVTGAAQENLDGNNLTTGSIAGEAGDPNYVDNSLSAYTKQGVYYDKEAKVWMYKDKPIHCLYDEGYTTFVDYSSLALKNGLSLKVVRTTNGSIERLAEMTEAEVNALFN
jgi:beta-lactamase regulating signal transducer with metallopeptidase domain